MSAQSSCTASEVLNPVLAKSRIVAVRAEVEASASVMRALTSASQVARRELDIIAGYTVIRRLPSLDAGPRSRREGSMKGVTIQAI